VQAYSIGSSGLLTSLGTATIANPRSATPRFLLSEPSGKFVYAVCSQNSILTFSIGSNGVLTQSASYTSFVNPYAIASDPSGSYFYVVNNSSNLLQAFQSFTLQSITSSGSGLNLGSGSVTVPLQVISQGQRGTPTTIAQGATANFILPGVDLLGIFHISIYQNLANGAAGGVIYQICVIASSSTQITATQLSPSTQQADTIYFQVLSSSPYTPSSGYVGVYSQGFPGPLTVANNSGNPVQVSIMQISGF
jgi:hypothetical protein